MACAVLLLSSCAKTEAVQKKKVLPDYSILQQDYYAESHEDALNQINAFLAIAGFAEQSAKEGEVFQDIEMVQGNWLFEGANNLLHNVNYSKSQSAITEYSIEIDAHNNSSGLKVMQGSDFTSEFQILNNQLSAYNTSNGTLTRIVDSQIESVSSNTVTLSVKAFHGSTPVLAESDNSVSYTCNGVDFDELQLSYASFPAKVNTFFDYCYLEERGFNNHTFLNVIDYVTFLNNSEPVHTLPGEGTEVVTSQLCIDYDGFDRGCIWYSTGWNLNDDTERLNIYNNFFPYLENDMNAYTYTGQVSLFNYLAIGAASTDGARTNPSGNLFNTIELTSLLMAGTQISNE